MKICAYSKAWRSGTGWFIHSLVEELARKGSEILFICPEGSVEFEPTNPRVERWRPPRELAADAPRIRRAVRSLNRVTSAMIYLIAARRNCKVFVVSIPDPLIFSLPIFALLRLTGARFIYVVHDPLPHAWRLPSGLRGVEMLGYTLSYRVSSHLVVLAESAKGVLVDAFRIAPTKIEIIAHVPFRLGPPTDIPGSRRLLLFGTLRRNKGILAAIEGVLAARARGLDVRLLVAGEPHNEDWQYWQSCVEAAEGHEDAIEMRIGYVPHGEMNGLIAECDAFLLPYTDFNSQSGVATLAASNGRPVIATPAGGVGEMLREGMPGIAVGEPVSAESVADAVCAFYATPASVWRSRSKAFHAQTVGANNWDSITKAYLALVRRFT